MDYTYQSLVVVCLLQRQWGWQEPMTDDREHGPFLALEKVGMLAVRAGGGWQTGADSKPSAFTQRFQVSLMELLLDKRNISACLER